MLTEPKVSEVLEQAYKLIEDPKHWTQGTMARDSKGIRIEGRRAKPVCFCSAGAIRHALGMKMSAKPTPLYEKCLRVFYDVIHTALVDFNDKKSHRIVMQAWRETIEYVKQQEAKEQCHE